MENICATPNCNKNASMKCPTCISYNMKDTFFCDQECFKSYWKIHNLLHKRHKEIKDFIPPKFNYTGNMRPHYVSPQFNFPKNIPPPDYYLTGIPLSEKAAYANPNFYINTPEQIKIMREACRLGREVLDLAGHAVRVGITTDEIDLIVQQACIDRNVYPSPLNYRDYPKSCCTSVNEIICILLEKILNLFLGHGIPDARPLQDGDIINIDVSIFYKGMHSDLNEMYCVGNVSNEGKRLLKVAHDCLFAAIEQVKPKALIRDFGGYIQDHVSKFGYDVVRNYCGHGVGTNFHCPPNIPHYKKNKTIGFCKPGMTFSIEPMINIGTWRDVTWPDDWTSATEDGKLSAQYEHTLLVTEDGVDILTKRNENSPKFWWELEPETVDEIMAISK